MRISTPDRYGPLQTGFSFEFIEGYSVLVGRNNSGKSAILQLVFRTLMRDTNFANEKLCLLLTERDLVQATTETGGSNLSNFNGDVLSRINGTPLQHSGWGVPWDQLPRILLNHTNTLRQIEALNVLLARLELPEFVLRTSQLIHFENIPVAFQGSGLRSLLSILAALTDTQLSAILIDEPELSLEPNTQRVLREILIEASKSKRILVATHSHLFLNRSTPTSNFLVQSSGGITSVSPVESEEQLYDLTFRLLGNSTEDLFFPGNFLVVEGASDQAIVERVRDLLEIPQSRLKVLSAAGVDSIPSGLNAVSRMLTPVVMRDSPYANKVVAMIDQPLDPTSTMVGELRQVLKERLFVLDRPSIEEYVPEGIYTRIGRNKSEDIDRMSKMKSDRHALIAFKKELSQQVSAQLAVPDLKDLPIVVSAVRRATE
jgi:energy-coupling factor transporter ATP-binding protein EcfA2